MDVALKSTILLINRQTGTCYYTYIHNMNKLVTYLHDLHILKACKSVCNSLVFCDGCLMTSVRYNGFYLDR